MVTAQDIENARRLRDAAIGTPDEQARQRDLEILVAQAKREHRVRVAS